MSDTMLFINDFPYEIRSLIVQRLDAKGAFNALYITSLHPFLYVLAKPGVIASEYPDILELAGVDYKELHNDPCIYGKTGLGFASTPQFDLVEKMQIVLGDRKLLENIYFMLPFQRRIEQSSLTYRYSSLFRFIFLGIATWRYNQGDFEVRCHYLPDAKSLTLEDVRYIGDEGTTLEIPQLENLNMRFSCADSLKWLDLQSYSRLKELRIYNDQRAAALLSKDSAIKDLTFAHLTDADIHGINRISDIRLPSLKTLKISQNETTQQQPLILRSIHIPCVSTFILNTSTEPIIEEFHCAETINCVCWHHTGMSHHKFTRSDNDYVFIRASKTFITDDEVFIKMPDLALYLTHTEKLVLYTRKNLNAPIHAIIRDFPSMLSLEILIEVESSSPAALPRLNLPKLEELHLEIMSPQFNIDELRWYANVKKLTVIDTCYKLDYGFKKWSRGLHSVFNNLEGLRIEGLNVEVDEHGIFDRVHEGLRELTLEKDENLFHFRGNRYG